MNLEDKQSASGLISIDFSKAFNRMDHSSCLRALRESRVSEGWVNIVAAFLFERRMAVNVNGVWSESKMAPGGAPQGSMLGCRLFCMTTDWPEPLPTGLLPGKRRTLRPYLTLGPHVDEINKISVRFISRLEPRLLLSPLGRWMTVLRKRDSSQEEPIGACLTRLLSATATASPTSRTHLNLKSAPHSP